MFSGMYIQVLTAFKKIGMRRFIRKLVLRLFHHSVAIPLALVFILISPLVKIRLIKLYSWRIGHFGMNTHLMLCARDANTFKEKKRYYTFFYTDPQYPICNQQLYKMWKRVICILPFSGICFYVDRWLIPCLGNSYNNDFKQLFEHSRGGNDQWSFFEKYKKIYPYFTRKEQRSARELMGALGIPVNAKFVCLLVRDNKYLKELFPDGNDWMYHSYRDANIKNFEAAVQYLAEAGYYVIKMGCNKSEKLNVIHPRVIDYAVHKLRNDLLDIYLSAHCHFFITTSTGIDCVPQIFRRPVLAVNMIPFDTNRSDHQNWLLCMPKKIMHLETQIPLSYNEVIQEATRLGRVALLASFEKKGLALVENSSKEILDAVQEMIVVLQKGHDKTKEAQLIQTDFWRSLLPKNKTLNLRARLCMSFVKNNPEIFSYSHADVLIKSPSVVPELEQ